MDKSAYEIIFSKIQELEANTACSECDEVFKDPVIIGRCGHTFCHNCVLKLSEHQCPTCKVPIEKKDIHEDRQLRDLLPLIQELKLILEETTASENQPPNIQSESLTNDVKIDQSSDKTEKSPLNRSSTRTRRIRKKVKCNDSDCCLSPRVCLTPVKLLKTTSKIVTPGISPVRKGSAMKSPLGKQRRSPFRYSAFSSSKYSLKKAKSPSINGSPLPSNLEKKNIKGETLLHVAVIKGDIQRVTMLLEKKAEPNVKDHAGWTPLHEASQKGFLEITKLLVEHGAAINVNGPENITPLHDAILNNHVEVAKFLVSANADLYLKTSRNLTALDLCEDDKLKKALLSIKSNDVETAEAVKKIKSPPEKLRPRLLHTSLDETQVEDMQKCAKEVLNASVVNNFTISVSHVVTTLDKQKKCKRTIKILQGILCGKWVVSYEWIEACLKQKKIISETAYEAKGTVQQPIISGPTRARLNAEKQLPSLFHGCFFYLHGFFNPPCPPKEILGQLIQLGGGRLLAREPKPETVKLEKFSAPYHSKNGTKFTHFILCQDKSSKQNENASDHICTVNFLWLVNSICSFTLLDPNCFTN